MGFPDLEGTLKILRYYRIHEVFDGMFFADESEEEEPDTEGYQNYQRHATNRVAEPF